MNRLLQKAREAATDARTLFAGLRCDGACNRAYYAMFNAARALLVTRGHHPKQTKTHATVLQLFSLEFVRNGPFDPEDGRALRRAEKARHVADYDDMGVTSDEAGAIIASMDKFMSTAERILDNEPGSERGKP